MTLQDCRGRNGVRAGGHGKPEGQALIQIASKRSRVLRHRPEVRRAAHGHKLEPNPIKSNFNLVRVFHSSHQIERISPEPDLDDVLAVQGKRVPDENPSPCAERQTIEMLVLREVGTHAIG